MAIHCSKITYLGNDMNFHSDIYERNWYSYKFFNNVGAQDCDITGRPHDINGDTDVRKLLGGISYSVLKDHLALLQFSSRQLPDIGKPN